MTRALLAITLLAAAACSAGRNNPAAQILLFTGAGTSPGDVDAFQSLLDGNSLAFNTASSWTMNRMSEQELRRYRLLIIPGGNFIHIGENLTPQAANRIRAAVQNGVNYLGVCAGGFLAGKTGYNSLQLIPDVRFGFYAAETHGIRKAAVPVTVAEGPTLEQYWEDGPEFTGWGAVAGKYPDGTPAIVQGRIGAGWVVLSGVHPEAPERWRAGMNFHTTASQDNAYAAQLIRAALDGTPLPHY